MDEDIGQMWCPKDEDRKKFCVQTDRAFSNFPIRSEKMGKELIYSYLLIKKAAAEVNFSLKVLNKEKKEAICKACDLITQNFIDSDHFPLSIWQSGSGTQTNMNVNEIIAYYASKLGIKIHPNDDVNRSQSTNDTFLAAMQIALIQMLKKKLFPSIDLILEELKKKEKEFSSLVKVGRTHFMDAVPLTLGEEFSSYIDQIEKGKKRISASFDELLSLPLGATAVGTGINAPKGFGKKIVSTLKGDLHEKLEEEKNHFSALSSMHLFLDLSSSLKEIGIAYYKMANDISFLASGPRAGIAELKLPDNEPGSSIMPGKTNPTQCEMIKQIIAHVIGNDATITFAASQGHLELNTFRPVIYHNLRQSIHLLSDGGRSFVKRLLIPLKADKEKIDRYLSGSLMSATLLNEHIGYEKAAQIVKKAEKENITVKEAALALGFLNEKEWEKIFSSKNFS